MKIRAQLVIGRYRVREACVGFYVPSTRRALNRAKSRRGYVDTRAIVCVHYPGPYQLVVESKL